ncbi:hypothetical protein K3495_g6102 [Podosphaera aphanis]|nr:hypothetical protein K3495_g6102 [Podosphaera aphanis]
MARTSTSSGKAKRHKKRKPRTEVSSSSGSDGECETRQVKSVNAEEKISTPAGFKSMTDSEISDSFSKFYLAKVTAEFSNDLDQLRNADDFNNDSIQVLIGALQQGTSLFSKEEQRLIVMAGRSNDMSSDLKKPSRKL